MASDAAARLVVAAGLAILAEAARLDELESITLTLAADGTVRVTTTRLERRTWRRD